MLLYRYTKLMEEHSRIKGRVPEDGIAEDGRLAELMELRQKMSVELLGPIEEDCSDWAAEATY